MLGITSIYRFPQKTENEFSNNLVQQSKIILVKNLFKKKKIFFFCKLSAFVRAILYIFGFSNWLAKWISW